MNIWDYKQTSWQLNAIGSFAIRHVTEMKLSIQGNLAYVREELHPFRKLKFKKREREREELQ